MKNKKGFTMIELLVVISVIVLLTALIIIAVTQVRVKGNNSRIKGDMDQLRKQAEVIYAVNGMATYCTPGVVNGCLVADANNLNVTALSDDIASRNGSGGAPTLNKSESAYCISAVLADSTNICYDSTGKQTYGAGLDGTCNAINTTVCQ